MSGCKLIGHGLCVALACLSVGSTAWADTFGIGENQFRIDFVTISGTTSTGSFWGNVDNDYRMGVYEITNGQWERFEASLRVPVTGTPSNAYDESPAFTGANLPVNNVSWLEAAQFVNWLNTSTGHHAAYKFTGTQGTAEYSFDLWEPDEADGGTNLYRHKDAMYYLPTDHEWTRAAYWNGNSLQDYATKTGEIPHKGDGLSGAGWNFWEGGSPALDPQGPWNVGSGSEELNGTFDMMGNVWEYMENAYYWDFKGCARRGGGYANASDACQLGVRANESQNYEAEAIGFRVASDVPEPVSGILLAAGAVVLLRRRNRKSSDYALQTPPD